MNISSITKQLFIQPIVTISALATILIFSTNSCGDKKSLNVSNLPELPPEILTDFDTSTFTSKLYNEGIFPTNDTNTIAHIPICEQTSVFKMSVKKSFTVCFPKYHPQRPPAPEDPATSFYKLTIKNDKISRVIEPYYCITSEGPWDATLLETKHCNTNIYTYRLLININLPQHNYQEQVVYTWGGSIAGHPASVQKLSCSKIRIERRKCPGETPTDACQTTMGSGPCYFHGGSW
ncbi:MAG TPA: hypothetical protein PLP34_03055 [Chitinophagaceae bacterium]|nr:hypothetical protein [Chitinophagaceae bacterium]